MAKAQDILSREDYKNYRNVRAVSVLFVLFGSVLVLGGVSLTAVHAPNPQEQVHPAVAIGMAVVGMAGVVGGIATLRGSRRWSPLIYVLGAVYMLGFPIGTILSFVLFYGLARYLDCVERLRVAASDT